MQVIGSKSLHFFDTLLALQRSWVTLFTTNVPHSIGNAELF